jgi:FG-GAP repeat
MVAMAAACTLAVPTRATGEPGVFVERDVDVLHVFEGDAGGGGFGWAVSSVADVDGDGVSEVLTSAPFNTAGGSNAGRAYLYSGAAGGLLFTWTGAAADFLGYAIADAGDVDGDAIPDVIVGAPGLAPAPGVARLFSGADGTELVVLSGEAPGGAFGAAVTGVGDVDGDGRADVLVGAETHASLAPAAGRVYLFAAVDWTTPLWTRDGAMGDLLGSGAGPLGDANGDTIPDVVAGARGHGGAVWVLSGMDGSDVHPPLLGDANAGNLGQFFVAGVGDLDGDAVPDVYGGDYGDTTLGMATGRAYVWSGASGERLYEFGGAAAGEGLGCGRGAGDADGDGTPDLAIGSYNASPQGVAQAGFITVFSGATGAVIRTITGTTPMEQLGFDVVGMGDVDGDARDDLVMSGASDNRVYVIAGGLEDSEESTGGDTSTGAEESSSNGAVDTTAAEGGTSGGDSGTSTGGGATSTIAETTDGSTGSSSSSGAAVEDSSGDGCSCRADGSPRHLAWLLVPFACLRRRRAPTSSTPQ